MELIWCRNCVCLHCVFGEYSSYFPLAIFFIYKKSWNSNLFSSIRKNSTRLEYQNKFICAFNAWTYVNTFNGAHASNVKLQANSNCAIWYRVIRSISISNSILSASAKHLWNINNYFWWFFNVVKKKKEYQTICHQYDGRMQMDFIIGLDVKIRDLEIVGDWIDSSDINLISDCSRACVHRITVIGIPNLKIE